MIGAIPGAPGRFGRVFDNMDVLRGHIALRQKIDAVTLCIFCDVYDQHGVAG